mmetsp:Transcript_35490/g.107198  ORF Transcript_35490/g.107198 Transcript_35490/m.107198 type:complete len:365 (+) Transcript_35490:416-1510(+)
MATTEVPPKASATGLHANAPKTIQALASDNALLPDNASLSNTTLGSLMAVRALPFPRARSSVEASNRCTTINTAQANNTPTLQNGTLTESHCPQLMLPPCCCKIVSAAMFCGEEMGVVMPPMLQEKARPSKSAREYRQSVGMSRNNGFNTSISNKGAVTFESNADKPRPKNMIANMKRKGLPPSRRCKNDAVRHSSWHVVNTELITKPHSTKYKESVNTLAKTRFACSCRVPSSTFANTASGGTSSAVPSKGAASKTHIDTVNTKRPTHLCARSAPGSSGADNGTTIMASSENSPARLIPITRDAPAPCRSSIALLRSSWIFSGDKYVSSSLRQAFALWPPKGLVGSFITAKALRFKCFSTKFF